MKISFKVIVLWVLAAGFLSIASLAGLALAVIFAYWGYRIATRDKRLKAQEMTSYKVAFDEMPATRMDVDRPGARTNYDATKYDVFEYKVKGVTFNNGRKSRQAILRRIYLHDEPFNKRLDVEISQYDFEGEPALGVYVNGEQIGNISRNEIQRVMQHTTPGTTLGLNVYGGGKADDGTQKSFGAVVKVLVPKGS